MRRDLSDKATTAEGAPVSGKRWCYAALGLALLLFLGIIYAWSIFVPALEEEFGWSRSETALAFSLCISMFCLGGLVSGLASKRLPFRRIVAACALFLGAGFILASRADSLAEMYLGYSGLVGLGVGMGYNAILSNMLRWFPDKTGIVSGLMLMGFGAGALVLGPLCHRLLNSAGWRETFFAFGIAYAVLYLAASFLINPPPADAVFPQPRGGKKTRESGGEVSAGQMLRRKSFYIYFAWAVIMNGIGMALIGHASSIAQELGIAAAAAAVLTGIISMANGLGRMLGGFCFDLFGRKTLMRGASVGVILYAGLLLVCLRTGDSALVTLIFIISGLCYGLGVIAHSAVIASFYGTRNYPLNFSIITMHALPGSFAGPYLAGLAHNALHSYAGLPYQALLFGGIALSLALLLKRP